MIVTTQKPIDEIMDFIAPFKNILIVGCDGCTQPPRGIKEAETLSQLLDLAGKLKGKNFIIKTTTIAKQCDLYLVETNLKSQVNEADAVLSLACGIGIQELSKACPEINIFPAQNTHFMGAEEREEAIIEERCAGCGNCMLALTGGVCPVARCTKGLLNGACGGAKNGKCELSPDRDCGWCLIYEQLKTLGKLELLKDFRAPRDYQLSGWRVTT